MAGESKKDDSTTTIVLAVTTLVATAAAAVFAYRDHVARTAIDKFGYMIDKDGKLAKKTAG